MKFFKKLKKFLHFHNWELVGIYTSGYPPESVTYQYVCRTCGKWENKIDKF